MIRKPPKRCAPAPHAAAGAQEQSGQGDGSPDANGCHGLARARGDSVVPATELERRRRGKREGVRSLFGEGAA